MSFWLDDDEHFQASQPSNVSSTPGTRNTVYGVQGSVFICSTCGGSESYDDPVSGNAVCKVCYTESQNTQEQGADYEDVFAVAARSGTGGLRMVRKKGAGRKGQNKILLETYNRATTLPTVSECLEGVRSVLEHCTQRIIEDILPNDQFAEIDTLRTRNFKKTVRSLWLAYIRAWSDGAEHYGKLHPTVRFSFRDFFLSPRVYSLLYRKLLVKKAQDAVAAKEAGRTEHDESRVSVDSDNSVGSDNSADSDKSVNSDNSVDSAAASEPNEMPLDEVAPGPEDPISCADAHVPKKFKPEARFSTKVRQESFDDMLRRTLRAGGHFGHKEAALSTRPSMALLAAILWMALVHSGTAVITATEVCEWVRTSQVPLANAFGVCLSRNLRSNLYHARSFFRIKNPALHPHQLERLACKLVIAARMKKRCAPVVRKPSHHHIQFAWTPKTLPIVIAKLVASAGLAQDVLDRTLRLAGLENSVGDTQIKSPLNRRHFSRRAKPYIPIAPRLVSPEYLTMLTELIALITIAIQMDPDWRSWEYHLLAPPVAAFNEGERRCDPQVTLEYAIQKMYPKEADSLLPDGWIDSFPPEEHEALPDEEDMPLTSGDKPPSPTVRPCLVVGGGKLPAKEVVESEQMIPLSVLYDRVEERPSRAWASCDFHQERLVQYLAYVSHIKDATEVHSLIERFVLQKNRQFYTEQRLLDQRREFRDMLKMSKAQI